LSAIQHAAAVSDPSAQPACASVLIEAVPGPQPFVLRKPFRLDELEVVLADALSATSGSARSCVGV
jgi:hypothetical protein